MTHEDFMAEAVAEAIAAAQEGEVPVGAVIVRQGKIIARGRNTRESAKDPTAHAELLAIREAARVLGGWRLIGCSLYVTLEPCPMCAGAIVNSRIEQVYYGAADPKAGYCGTLHDTLSDPRLNHRPQVQGGIMADECAAVLSDFFGKKRRAQKADKKPNTDD